MRKTYLNLKLYQQACFWCLLRARASSRSRKFQQTSQKFRDFFESFAIFSTFLVNFGPKNHYFLHVKAENCVNPVPNDVQMSLRHVLTVLHTPTRLYKK